MVRSMEKLINLRDYRQRRRRQFFAQYGVYLDKFIFHVLQQRVNEDFVNLAYKYFTHQINNNEMAWDYQDLRENIRRVLEEACREQILSELRYQRWYDSRWISPDEVIDRCLTVFILGLSRVANQ